MIARRLGVFVLVAALSACAPGRWSVNEVNDYFTLFNKDHDYTQGLIVSHENENRSISVGQKIFTAVHKKESPAPSDERPYAGYLFTEFRKYSDEPPIGERPYAAIELGFVGPGALGKEAQCGVHKILGQLCPKGWPQQLDAEPGITLRAGTSITKSTDFLFTKGEIVYDVEGELGNISTGLILGNTVRYRLAPGLTAFAGPKLHLVARDIFLDGNTFQDSPSVTRNWAFSELGGGVVMDIPYFPRTTWFIKIQSKQYKEQEGTYNHGGVEFSWEN